jgi:transposase
MAVGRTILQMAYHMIRRGEVYRELGNDYFDQFDKARTAKRLIKRLEAMGYRVDVTDHPLAQPRSAVSHSAQSRLPLVV